MKTIGGLVSLLVVLMCVESKHTFLGTNVMRPLIHNHIYKFNSKLFRKRVENATYVIPNNTFQFKIQGILAYDLTNSDATANVTSGGLGYSFVYLRMKSERGKPLAYDVYIYA